MNEADTRAEHIDPALKAAGWGVVDGSRVRREVIAPGRLLGRGQRSQADIADYVLIYRNTKLAVIEAKAWDKAHTEGLGQAKRYAAKLAVRFSYSTNGQALYGVDMATGAEGDVAAYPSPDDLWAMTFAEADAKSDPATATWRARFAAIPFEDKGGTWQGRYYQDIAVSRVLETIAAGRDRILLTLATGTGKTFIAFQLAWKLFQSRWNLADWRQTLPTSTPPSRRPRVLFLADRNNLAGQAYNAFSAFPDDALVRLKPDDIRKGLAKTGRVPKNGSIFFTIFQTFMSGTGPEGQAQPYFGDYPPDFFDFIVIDECHRGGARDESTWRAILDYFAPAVQLGLTATPKRSLNTDTYAYFGEPVYVYSLRDGINDGYLTPFRVKQIATTLDDYVYTPDDDVVAGHIEPGRRYDEKDFNRIIQIKEREAYRVQLFMGMIDPREKTIVFCATQLHALAVRDLVNQFKRTSPPFSAQTRDPLYCVRVTASDGAIGDEHLRAFQDNEKTIPTVLTTSQKLSTGVDARNVRNIVLMRPVASMIEFKQIIGRGTRLYDGKDHFTVYDFVRAHHHFNDPAWDGEPLAPEVPEDRAPHAVAAADGADPAALRVAEPEPVGLRAAPIEVKLADGKLRRVQHMAATTFWSPDGRPMSAAQFLQSLFGSLPGFFKDEDELRRLWSAPDTRKTLLAGLADKGFGREALADMQKVIEAENSDLFDVLAYVAFATNPVTRADRAAAASAATAGDLPDRQQAFVDFVLAQYVKQGVGELDADKLSPLLRLRYQALGDAFAELGQPDQVRHLFLGFQQHLYGAGIRAGGAGPAAS